MIAEAANGAFDREAPGKQNTSGPRVGERALMPSPPLPQRTFATGVEGVDFAVGTHGGPGGKFRRRPARAHSDLDFFQKPSSEIFSPKPLPGRMLSPYDAAKKAARLSKAKGAHDALIAAAHRAQADALEIEAGAKRRLADEYDAAQERGELARNGDNLPSVPERNSKPTAADIGISRKAIHEARIIRDAEEEEPGIVRRTLDEVLDAGEEPTRAKVSRAVCAARHVAGFQDCGSTGVVQRRRTLCRRSGRSIRTNRVVAARGGGNEPR
jgi:hypothetical protein